MNSWLQRDGAYVLKAKELNLGLTIVIPKMDKAGIKQLFNLLAQNEGLAVTRYLLEHADNQTAFFSRGIHIRLIKITEDISAPPIQKENAWQALSTLSLPEMNRLPLLDIRIDRLVVRTITSPTGTPIEKEHASQALARVLSDYAIGDSTGSGRTIGDFMEDVLDDQLHEDELCNSLLGCLTNPAMTRLGIEHVCQVISETAPYLGLPYFPHPDRLQLITLLDNPRASPKAKEYICMALKHLSDYQDDDATPHIICLFQETDGLARVFNYIRDDTSTDAGVASLIYALSAVSYLNIPVQPL
jgi:hypothetical protein